MIRDEVSRLHWAIQFFDADARRLGKENERLQAIADEVEKLYHETDLFTSCATGVADRLIKLIEKKGSE